MDYELLVGKDLLFLSFMWLKAIFWAVIMAQAVKDLSLDHQHPNKSQAL